MALISWSDAADIVDNLVVPDLGAERVPLAAAHGRVLAEDVMLQRSVPPFDRATMDGFAVMGEHPEYVVKGRILAGQTWDRPLHDGEAIRIMTGAPAPAESAVIPIECTDATQGRPDLPEPQHNGGNEHNGPKLSR